MSESSVYVPYVFCTLTAQDSRPTEMMNLSSSTIGPSSERLFNKTLNKRQASLVKNDAKITVYSLSSSTLTFDNHVGIQA